MSGYRVMACAPVWIGDRKTGIAQTKWFPALVGNHVADIVGRYGMDSDLVPKSLTSYIEKREGRRAEDGYDYKQHTSKESDNTYYVTDEITESFCLIGPPEAHVEKLKALEAAGVTQFNIYLTNGEEERLVADYAEHVIPHFK